MSPNLEIVTSNMIAKHAVRPGEIVVEIDEEHLDIKSESWMDPDRPFDCELIKLIEHRVRCGNRNMAFPPCELRPRHNAEPAFAIRSRIEYKRDRGIRKSAAMYEIDYIPGERIHVDLANKIGRISDACFDPENKELRDRLKEASRNMGGQPNFMWVPSPPFERKFADDSEKWTWIYHMRKIIDGDSEHLDGPAANRGCALSGNRLCRPIQNEHLLPSLLQCLDAMLIPFTLPPMSEKDRKEFLERLATLDQRNRYNERTHSVFLSRYLYGVSPDAVSVADAHAV